MAAGLVAAVAAAAMLTAAAAAGAAASAPAGLYALKSAQGATWLARVLPNGTVVRVGSAGANSSWLSTQGLSVLDAARGELLAILADERDHNNPSLFRFSLATGDIAGVVPLPIKNGDTIGVGQIIALAPAATSEVLIGGSLATGEEVVGAVDRASGAFRVIGRLNSSREEVDIGCAVGSLDAAQGALFFGGLAPAPPYARFVLRVNLTDGAVSHVANPASHRISSYALDPATGLIVGLGSHGQQEEIIVASLDTRNETLSVIGSVPLTVLQYNLAGIVALDTARQELTWLGAANSDGPWDLVATSLASGAPITSQVQLCATLGQCEQFAALVFYGGG